jgi:hypothetical protein
VLAQLFNVRDNKNAAYLLGWQVVPYRGAGTYVFGTAGNILAVEPPTGGRPLGFGKGTVTFKAGSGSGTVRATITLTAGGAVEVKGAWACKTAGT